MEYLTLALLFLAVFLLKALASAGVLFFFSYRGEWKTYMEPFSAGICFTSLKKMKNLGVSVCTLKTLGPNMWVIWSS